MDHLQHVIDHREYVNALVMKWRRLAYKIASRYATLFKMQGDIDDMMSEAVVTVIRAAERYDPARGFQYPTYMGKAVAYRMIYMYEMKVKCGFTAAPSRPPYTKRVSDVTMSLPSGDTKSVNVVDLLTATPIPQYGDDITPDEMREAMRSVLTPREQEVLDLRFRGGLRLEDIGNRGWVKEYRATGKPHRFNLERGTLTKERVRMVQNESLEKLREWFASEAEVL